MLFYLNYYVNDCSTGIIYEEKKIKIFISQELIISFGITSGREHAKSESVPHVRQTD